MKKTQLITLLLFTLLSCNKESEYDKLPSITANGKNTFACLINGKLYFADSINAYLTSTQLTLNGQSSSQGKLSLCSNIMPAKFADLIDNFPLGINLDGSDSSKIAVFCNDKQYNSCFKTNAEKDLHGYIELTFIDTTINIISGTFWFNGKNISNDVIRVREGRFDVIYKKIVK